MILKCKYSNQKMKGRAMSKSYNQLSLKERKEIEKGLNRGDSFSEIARLIGRCASTISREVKENRIIKSQSSTKVKCRDRNWCKITNICDDCVREGAACC